MPYISATAEIMYAPLDLRFVMETQFRTASSQSIFSRDFSAKSVSFVQLRATVVGLKAGSELIRGPHPAKKSIKEVDFK